MPSSVHSSKSTSSENESFKDILHNDKVRYIRKGYGLINAILIVLSFYFILPLVAQPFYAKWMSLFESQMAGYFWGSILVHHGCFTIGNLGMLVIYKLGHPFFERYKINSQPWPWKSNSEKFRTQLKKTFIALAVNLLVVSPCSLMLAILADGVEVRFSADEFPSSWEIIVQIIFFMLVEDFCFYWAHRLLHHPKIYNYIHKKHHEYNTSISVASEYAHPFEFLFSNILPTSVGPMLLGYKMHFFTQLCWYVLRVNETIDGHSGYEFSWSPFRLLPFSGGANYHDYHHSHNQGNFGSFFSLWDTLCGTNSHYFRFLSIKQQEEDILLVKAQLDQSFDAKAKLVNIVEDKVKTQ
jgi:sterol desaturase/sphingolipid hydroxylase (fatty acid hydroxylase superfamily)